MDDGAGCDREAGNHVYEPAPLGQQGIAPRLVRDQQAQAIGLKKQLHSLAVHASLSAYKSNTKPNSVLPAEVRNHAVFCIILAITLSWKNTKFMGVFVDKSWNRVLVFLAGKIMKTPIKSLAEAKNELDSAIEHLTRIQVYMDNFQEVMNQFSAIQERLNISFPETGSARGQRDPSQMSLADRVFLLVSLMGHPVWPKEVASEYENRKWPPPRSGTVYDAVNGAMSYLFHRKHLLGRDDNGYFVAAATLSKDNDGEKAGEGARA